MLLFLYYLLEEEIYAELQLLIGAQHGLIHI